MNRLTLFFCLAFLNPFGFPSAEATNACHHATLESVTATIINDAFVTDRSILEHFREFEVAQPDYKVPKRSHSLVGDLLSLGPEDYAIDFGSGDGNAVAGLYYSLSQLIQSLRVRSGMTSTKGTEREKNPNVLFQKFLNLINSKDEFGNKVRAFFDRPISERPKALGITYNMRAPWHSDKAQFIHGHFFEDDKNIPSDSIPFYKIGFSYFGIFSYTSQPTKSLMKALNRLAPGGKLYIFGMRYYVTNPEQQEIDLKQTQNDLNNVVHGQGIGFWLRENLKGARVDIGFLGNGFDVIVIQRTDEPLSLPELSWLANGNGNITPPKSLFLDTGNPVIP